MKTARELEAVLAYALAKAKEAGDSAMVARVEALPSVVELAGTIMKEHQREIDLDSPN